MRDRDGGHERKSEESKSSGERVVAYLAESLSQAIVRVTLHKVILNERPVWKRLGQD